MQLQFTCGNSPTENVGSIAPIALFVYNRPWHTRQTIEALQQNERAKDSDLFIFADAPKKPEATAAVHEVREYVKTIGGFKSVSIVKRDINFGLANSIIDGVTRLSNEYGRVIVMEDDLVTSPYFLRYMNDALDLYEHEEKVISIHGYVYPVKNKLPVTFFLRGADCWGWATWKRGWALFNSDGQFLLNELNNRKLTRIFDFNGTYPFTKMLKNQIKGNNDSWAVRWYASAFVADKLTLYPGRSLVNNIGNDNSGTHCGVSRSLDVQLSNTPIKLNFSRIEPSTEARQEFEFFFRQMKTGWLLRLVAKVSGLLRMKVL